MNKLKHLQQTILLIIEDIDKLCTANHINYYLEGGSALGAIRHNGFIPWDDDLDIIMSAENYDKFIDICRTQLDTTKYYFQEGGKDWPLLFSKVKLRGTHLHELEGFGEEDGIFVDVFKMDNISDNNLVAYWQYFCGKLLLSNTLSQRSYESTTLKKKLLMLLSAPLNYNPIFTFLLKQVERYNKRETSRYGFLYGRTRFHSGIMGKKLFGSPKRVPFEHLKLPVPEYYHEYLTQVFGDYMTLPPENQRVGMHAINVDFGVY